MLDRSSQHHYLLVASTWSLPGLAASRVKGTKLPGHAKTVKLQKEWHFNDLNPTPHSVLYPWCSCEPHSLTPSHPARQSAPAHCIRPSAIQTASPECIWQKALQTALGTVHCSCIGRVHCTLRQAECTAHCITQSVLHTPWEEWAAHSIRQSVLQTTSGRVHSKLRRQRLVSNLVVTRQQLALGVMLQSQMQQQQQQQSTHNTSVSGA